MDVKMKKLGKTLAVAVLEAPSMIAGGLVFVAVSVIAIAVLLLALVIAIAVRNCRREG